MEKLPDLAIEHILSSLDVADLLACSMVNVGWRATTNNNRVWKNICYRTSNKATIEHLQTVHSTVSPTFEEPESTNPSLEPVCYWRVMYMKIMRVKQNWQRANHNTCQVSEMAYNFFEIKINNDILVANVSDNECAVWNVKGTPRKQETVVCALKNTRCKCMINLYNNRLVVIQDSLLQVYSKSSSTFSLCYRRLFNQPEAVSASIPGSLNIDEWYNEQVPRRPAHLQAHHVGEYFIGLAHNGPYEITSFHVWNTTTGCKLKEEPIKDICPKIKDPVYNVKFCTSKSDLGKILVCVYHTHTRRSHVEGSSPVRLTIVYLYDLTTFTFKKLQEFIPHISFVYYENGVFITVDNSRVNLRVFKSTGDCGEVVCKHYEEIINPDSVQVYEDYLGFTTGGDVVILNMKDYDLVFTTAIVKFSSSMFGFDFHFLDWDLILIARWDRVNKVEVWNIKEKTLKSTLKTNGLMFPCFNRAKFFIWNEMVTTIYMLQFW